VRACRGTARNEIEDATATTLQSLKQRNSKENPPALGHPARPPRGLRVEFLLFQVVDLSPNS
jgi:hypothetical protein